MPVFGNSIPFWFHGTFLSTSGYWPLSIPVVPFGFRSGPFSSKLNDLEHLQLKVVEYHFNVFNPTREPTNV
jgi:hypothetical protein